VIHLEEDLVEDLVDGGSSGGGFSGRRRIFWRRTEVVGVSNINNKKIN
jgi:hypothetical protein